MNFFFFLFNLGFFFKGANNKINFFQMRFLYIFLVAAFLAVAYAATTSDTETEVEQVPHSRQKRTILLKKKLALLGGALLAKKLIAGKLLYKG